MEAVSTIKELKEKICNLEQALFLASKLVSKYEEILDKSPTQEWCLIRKEILNESSRLRK
jgi:hypothetical protein